MAYVKYSALYLTYLTRKIKKTIESNLKYSIFKRGNFEYFFLWDRIHVLIKNVNMQEIILWPRIFVATIYI